MPIKPPFTQLEIEKAPSGFYEGYSLPIALISKSIMVALVVWALVWPGNASSVLSAVNGSLLNGFNGLLHHLSRCIRVLPLRAGPIASYRRQEAGNCRNGA